MQTISNPILILIRGLPGSGKTYVAAALKQALAADVVALDPDATDYESEAYKTHVQKLTTEGVDPKLHAYRFLRSQAYAGIEAHQIILWNQPFTNLEIFHKMVNGLQAYALDHETKLDILVVEVEIDPAVAQQRVLDRKQAGGHGPSETTFARFVTDYHSFAGEGYETVVVNGQNDVQESVQTIISAVEQLVAE